MSLRGWRTGTEHLHGLLHSALRLDRWCDDGQGHCTTRLDIVTTRDSRSMLVHTPVHASWLTRVELSCSIMPRKVLTPNDVVDVEAMRLRLALYEAFANLNPVPCQWQCDRKLEARQRALANAHPTCLDEAAYPEHPG